MRPCLPDRQARKMRGRCPGTNPVCPGIDLRCFRIETRCLRIEPKGAWNGQKYDRITI